MRRYVFIVVIILLCPVVVSGANWEEHGMRIVSRNTSTMAGAERIELRDGNGRRITVNYRTYPEDARRRRALELEAVFHGWRRISPEPVEFFFADDGIYANMMTRRITYENKNLMPYLPAGLTFCDGPDGLCYRFRILVNDTSYRLDRKYIDEEALLRDITSFIESKENPTVMSAGQGTYSSDRPDVPGMGSGYVKSGISLHVRANYLTPLGDIGKTFSDGYGAMAVVTLHNMGISLNGRDRVHLDFSLSAGYWKLKKKEINDPEMNCNIDHAYIIPIYLMAHVPFDIYGGIFLAPSIGVGYNYNSMDYCKMTVEGVQQVRVREWAPSLTGGGLLGWRLFGGSMIATAGVEYMAMFERERNVLALVWHAGAGLKF
ncbi:MAG TPA: hypothetical protein PLT75_08955 [Spirochaetota bacterium]|nr:hypothetical protein [Spirochaetota bacterium]